MAAPKFVWTAFYSGFADRLLEYRSGLEELVRKIKKVYADIGMRLPKLEVNNDRLRDQSYEGKGRCSGP